MTSATKGRQRMAKRFVKATTYIKRNLNREELENPVRNDFRHLLDVDLLKVTLVNPNEVRRLENVIKSFVRGNRKRDVWVFPTEKFNLYNLMQAAANCRKLPEFRGLQACWGEKLPDNLRQQYGAQLPAGKEFAFVMFRRKGVK